jgi:hypothetical protein
VGYDFTINKGWFKIKPKEKEYPWPCESDVGRMITIFDDDVLTHQEGNSYMKHTGIGCFGIIIPEEDLVEQSEPAHLRII